MKLTRGLEQRTLRLVSSLPFVQGPRVCVHPYVHACETETNDDKISAPTQRNTPLCARSDPPPPLPAVAIRRMFRVHLALAHDTHNTTHNTSTHRSTTKTRAREKNTCHAFSFRLQKESPAAPVRPRTIEVVSHTALQFPLLSVPLRRRGASTHRLCTIGAAGRASSEDPGRKVSKRTPFAGKARCCIYSLLIHLLYCIYCTRISKLLELKPWRKQTLLFPKLLGGDVLGE